MEIHLLHSEKGGWEIRSKKGVLGRSPTRRGAERLSRKIAKPEDELIIHTRVGRVYDRNTGIPAINPFPKSRK